MQLPSYLQVEPVGQCNLRCEMCSIQFRQDGPPYGPPAFMAFDVFTRLIDEFEGLEHLHLQGLGEPMMHPRFFDMVAYATGRGARVTTNSNMTLLNPRRAEQCVTSGLETLHVSIDGATAETFENIRHGARLERVLRNVAMLLDARRTAGGAGPRLHMVVVLMRRNLDELPDLVRLAGELEVEELFVQRLAHDFAEATLPAHYAPMRAFVDAETLAGEDPVRVERAFTHAREVAAAAGVRLRLPRAVAREHEAGTPGRARCDWPWTGAYVAWDGRAMPCCMVATPDRTNFGSMADRGVVAVWEGDEYEAFRRALDSDAPPEICRTCAVYNGTF